MRVVTTGVSLGKEVKMRARDARGADDRFGTHTDTHVFILRALDKALQAPDVYRTVKKTRKSEPRIIGGN